jgi:hypothetical protein
MSEQADALTAHAAPSSTIAPVEADPAVLDAVHTATSTDGRVTAYVTGRLQFDRVEIDQTGDLDQLAESVLEAVNAAMVTAQAPMGGGTTGLEAEQQAIVEQFETTLGQLDEQMDAAMAKLDDLEKRL